MAPYYASTFVGVTDDTKNPPDRADGRLVGARPRLIIAPKVASQAWANGDKIYIGRRRLGETVRRITLTSDTSFGTTTISVGTIAAPTKYVNAKTMTVVDIPTNIGPAGSAADDSPDVAYEDLYVTLGVGGVAGAVLCTFEVEIAGLN